MRPQMAQVDYKIILDEAWQQHLKPKAKDAPTFISLFAGCGGSSLGYSMAGFRELLAVEWNDNAVATFKLNFPSMPVYHGDIHKLTVERCLEMADLQSDELDLLDGSPPCQGFSTAGKRRMNDKRNQLYMQFVRLLRGLQPKVFVMENVSGLVKGKMKLIFADIMRELKASGYQVRCKLLNAMYFHVPQSRRRLIWIGVRNDLKVRTNFLRAQNNVIQTGYAFAGLHDDAKERIVLEPESKTFQQMKIVKAGDRCKKHHSHHRLHCNLVAPTIDKGGGAGSYHVWHFTEHRPITTFELRRLFSFPDLFQRRSSVTDFFALVGNSVPPLFMRAIARHIKDTILTGGYVRSKSI